MKSQKANGGAKTDRRLQTMFCLALVGAGCLFSGCASIQQYSIDSWQGPLPLTDWHYVQVQQ